ncbi:50S ribosomal protein L24 [Candidatus Woesearchaeota archaeon]|nr:50S ribosomal protein L24 [Candidatus Woesearchaeota archaeon]
MKKTKRFSKTWKKSKSPRKQHKYRYNAPLHIRNDFVSVTLSKELKKKYSKRNCSAKKGDSIKVLRGSFKGKTGKINKIDLKRSKIYIDGIELSKKDGTKAFPPLEPSNLMLTELNLNDKKRAKLLERK